MLQYIFTIVFVVVFLSSLLSIVTHIHIYDVQNYLGKIPTLLWSPVHLHSNCQNVEIISFFGFPFLTISEPTVKY